MSESKVDLIVSGGLNFKPDLLTNYIKIVPDSVWEIGDKIGKSIRTREENAWIISSDYSKNDDISELLKSVIDKVTPARDELRDYIRSRDGMEIQVSIAIYVSEQAPILNLSPSLITELSILGASLDIDIICLEE